MHEYINTALPHTYIRGIENDHIPLMCRVMNIEFLNILLIYSMEVVLLIVAI